jgi:regulator of replication initiation timing
MTKEDVIIETLRRIEDNLASMDRDMAKDRQDIQNLSVGYEEIRIELVELRKAVNLGAERTKDKVAEVVQPIAKATENLSSGIAKSKTVIFGMEKSWWEKIKDKFSKNPKGSEKE